MNFARQLRCVQSPHWLEHSKSRAIISLTIEKARFKIAERALSYQRKMRSDFKPGDVVSCHTWSADGSRIAVCPNNNELHIYVNQPEQRWALEHVLQHHDKLISGVDWSWSTGGLVTCSHDLNAYVLKLKNGIWKPDMVRSPYLSLLLKQTLF